jgi:hypothetical protein
MSTMCAGEPLTCSTRSQILREPMVRGAALGLCAAVIWGSYLAIGLLREACVNGYRGCFYNAQALLDELYASLADRSTARLLTRLSRMQPLLIDLC